MPEAVKKAASPRGRKPVASREAILDAALDLLDAEGLVGFNVRGITAALNIGPMTLYSYFENKERLVDAMIERALDAPTPRPDPSVAWQDRLFAAISEAHAALMRHPGVIELLMSRLMSDPVLDPVRDNLLSILLDAGFDEAGSVAALRLLMGHALGSIILEAYQRLEPASFEQRMKDRADHEFPHLRRVAGHYWPPAPGLYADDLKDLIALLEIRLRRQAG